MRIAGMRIADCRLIAKARGKTASYTRFLVRHSRDGGSVLPGPRLGGPEHPSAVAKATTDKKGVDTEPNQNRIFLLFYAEAVMISHA